MVKGFEHTKPSPGSNSLCVATGLRGFSEDDRKEPAAVEREDLDIKRR